MFGLRNVVLFTLPQKCGFSHSRCIALIGIRGSAWHGGWRRLIIVLLHPCLCLEKKTFEATKRGASLLPIHVGYVLCFSSQRGACEICSRLSKTFWWGAKAQNTNRCGGTWLWRALSYLSVHFTCSATHWNALTRCRVEMRLRFLPSASRVLVLRFEDWDFPSLNFRPL